MEKKVQKQDVDIHMSVTVMMCLSDIRLDGVHCIHVSRLGAIDGLVGAVINIHIP
jgi:hypothetical protein